MSDRYARIVKFLEDYPWAMLPGALESLLEVVSLRIEGRMLTEEEIRARVGTPPVAKARTQGTVAVLPLFGVMAHRMNMLTDISGGTSTEGFGRAFRTLVHDPNISSIVLDVDSPGGSVFGVQELADEVFKARGTKPIVAVANAMAASAAYWVASQADEILVTPSGMVGSVGVVAIHEDRSKLAEKMGVKHTFITAGKFKNDGNGLAPLDDETRADMQRKVDQFYNAFVSSV